MAPRSRPHGWARGVSCCPDYGTWNVTSGSPSGVVNDMNRPRHAVTGLDYARCGMHDANMRTGHTDRYLLLQMRLGRDLDAFITAARSQGRGYREIAADLRAVTGLPVSYESVRQWEQRQVAA